MKKNTEADFWKYVDKRSTGCWIWIGKASGPRYGAFNLRGKVHRAHRFSWELKNGPITDGLHVLHKCDVGYCVNPGHLFLGTHQDNMDDRTKKGRTNPPVGSRNAWAKFTENEVRSIRRRYKNGETQVNLAAEYGVCQATISKICLKVSWKHI